MTKRARRTTPAPSRPLTARESRFVREYLLDLNATQAAIRAGYSKKTARQIGAETLSRPVIADAVAKAMAARAARTGINADRVLKETEAIAFSDVRHYTVDEDGCLHLAKGVADDAARAVSKVKHKVTTKTIGKETVTEREVEISLWNKPEMLKVAGRHVDVHGFADRMELTGKNGKALFNPSTLSDAELDARIRELSAEIAAGK